VDLAYSIRAGHSAEETLLQLKAVGTEYVAIHGPKSREYYRDYQRPERVAVTLPVVYHAEDDTIYRMPAHPLAHLLQPAELPRHNALQPYVAAIEDPARPALTARWNGTSALSIAGPVRAGDAVEVQVNADPGWRAAQDGRNLEMSQDGLGFIVLRAAPAAQTRIELEYRGTSEQRLMAALCILAWLAALTALPLFEPLRLFVRRGQKRSSALPQTPEARTMN
jgi:hypothetical protein